jgi:hypothetical protein
LWRRPRSRLGCGAKERRRRRKTRISKTIREVIAFDTVNLNGKTTA